MEVRSSRGHDLLPRNCPRCGHIGGNSGAETSGFQREERFSLCPSLFGLNLHKVALHEFTQDEQCCLIAAAFVDIRAGVHTYIQTHLCARTCLHMHTYPLPQRDRLASWRYLITF